MGADWNRGITLAAEFLFAVLFLRALWTYLRHRDPLRRSVTMVFAPCTALFAVAMVRQLGGSPPAWVSAASTTFLLAQPYLTLRLVGRLRRVPTRLDRTALAAFVVSAVIVTGSPRPLPPSLVLLAVVLFVAVEITAAVLLAAEGRHRTGSSGARLTIAAWATLILAITMIALGAAAVPGAAAGLDIASRILALCSGLGYLVAFLPPTWLRRLLSATAGQTVTERLLRAQVDSPEDVWQTYAEILRVQTAADAVAILVPGPDGGLTQPAYAGPPVPPPTGLTNADLATLFDTRQPVPLDRAGAVADHYARHLGGGFVTALPIPMPPAENGGVLMFTQYRSLFRDDDLRLLAELGGQAGALAERQAVTAEQRRLAAELAASVQALRRAGQAKSDFLASMSHELRTPLNAIIGFSDLMRQDDMVDGLRQVPADWVEHIHASGRHLLGLINDILDLAKVEAGRLDLRPAPLRVDTAIQESLTGLAPLLRAKSLRVETHLPPLVAVADRVRFRQILENLLSNAIKFTPEEGRIAVTATGTPSVVAITVSDTGVGIAPADHSRVFEEFQQVGDRDKQRAGTGLGLALTKRLVEAHGGEIGPISELGQGSAFTVRLPAAPMPSTEPDSPAPAASRRGRVLLIEDDPAAAELLSTQLRGAGYQVQVAASGESGLAQASTDPPDAIVLDVALPGIDGWEVMRRLRLEPTLADIPVYFASIIDERQAGLSLGAADYFVKPVDQTALLRALAQRVPGRPGNGHPRVLVVDHNEAQRRAVEESLRSTGAEVVGCADGAEGLALSRRDHFDLIVCDLQMPNADGFSLLAAIEQDAASARTPVVGVAAVADAAREAAGTGPLLATALAGGAGWGTLASLVGGTGHSDSDVEREVIR